MEEQLTAKAWLLMDAHKQTYLRGYNVHMPLQMASITKMYTLYGCLELNKSIGIIPQRTVLSIINCTKVGTLANLEEGQQVCLQHVYYGLMLPSGNDAAELLGSYYGSWLDKNAQFPQYWYKENKKCKFTLKGKEKYLNLYIKLFIKYLNEHIIKTVLHHKQTSLQNPSGLPNKHQLSTAWEIAKAAILFIQNSKFVKICGTKQYTAFYQNGQSCKWSNTNSLLQQQGYYGIKTGQTVPAGNCLCSVKNSLIDRKESDFIIVVLNCSSAQLRFTQTRKIVESYQIYWKSMQLIN